VAFIFNANLKGRKYHSLRAATQKTVEMPFWSHSKRWRHCSKLQSLVPVQIGLPRIFPLMLKSTGKKKIWILISVLNIKALCKYCK